MIFSSAVFVVVALGLLVGGVVPPGRPVLVYASIAVSAVAAVLLLIGVVIRRRELFGASESSAGADGDTASGAEASPAVGTAGKGKTAVHATAASTRPDSRQRRAHPPRPSLPDIPPSETVYVAAGLGQYHVASCRHLRSDDVRAVSYAEARREGLAACTSCLPDAALAARATARQVAGEGLGRPTVAATDPALANVAERGHEDRADATTQPEQSPPDDDVTNLTQTGAQYDETPRRGVPDPSPEATATPTETDTAESGEVASEDGRTPPADGKGEPTTHEVVPCARSDGDDDAVDDVDGSLPAADVTGETGEKQEADLPEPHRVGDGARAPRAEVTLPGEEEVEATSAGASSGDGDDRAADAAQEPAVTQTAVTTAADDDSAADSEAVETTVTTTIEVGTRATDTPDATPGDQGDVESVAEDAANPEDADSGGPPAEDEEGEETAQPTTAVAATGRTDLTTPAQSEVPDPGQPPGDDSGEEPSTPAPRDAQEEDPHAEPLVHVIPCTKRYHRATCSLVLIAESDVEAFPRSVAERDGCLPCSACQPDREPADV